MPEGKNLGKRPEELKSKFDFLYHSLEDARSIIRAMDIKSNVMNAIIGAIMLIVVKIIEIHNAKSILLLLVFLFGFLSILTYLLSVLTPRFNPENEIEDEIDKNYLYFPFGKKNIKNYVDEIKEKNDLELMEALAFERLKLQRIIEKKVYFFKISTYWFFLPFIGLTLVSIVMLKF